MKLIFAPDIKKSFEYLANSVGRVTKEAGRAWVIIPDQMALTAERELSSSLPAKAQLYYDIVSFRRLSNNIFRRFGGLSYNYADKSAEALILWRAMTECRDAGQLLLYGDTVGDASSVPVMMSAITELKQSMISPEAFAKAAVKLSLDGENSAIAQKYLDLSCIYTAYDEILTASYDDRMRDISAAAELLSENDFFGGSEVFVFAFSSFTAQQYSILKRAAGQCRDINIIFTLPSEYSYKMTSSPEFEGIADTVKRLHALSDSVKVPFETETLPTERNSEPSELAAAIFSQSSAISDRVPESIRLIECASEKHEAEICAAEIAVAVRGGLRYRDIAVVSGSPERYEGILDRIFDEYGIPCHMSRRIEIEKVPGAAAVMSALRVVTGGSRREDIISYCKTGFSPLTDDEADELLFYMSRWNISGKRFYAPDGDGWGMNPDGYTPTWTEVGEKMLQGVNRSRKKLTERLEVLYDAFTAHTTAEEKTAAVMEFAELSGISDGGTLTLGASASSQAADILGRALKGIPLIMGDGKMSARDYMSALRLILDTLTVGTLPSLTDEVEVTDPIRMRGAGYKLVILLGVRDGIFPADGGDGGFFSDSEKVLFEGEGLVIGSPDTLSSMELYNFCRAVSATYGELTVIYKPERGGALPDAVERIRTLYPRVKTEKYKGIRGISDIWSEAGMKRGYTAVSDGDLSLAIVELLSMTEDGRRILDAEKIPISQRYETVTDEEAEKLFGGDLSLSQSRLESYVMCKFGFYCRYVLKLAEDGRAALSYADIGTFIHAALERLFRVGFLNKNEGELSELIDSVIADYVGEVLPPEERGNTRILSLFKRLRRGVAEFISAFRAEFEVSRFTPVLFEVPIGIGGGESSIPASKIPLGDGTFAVLRGIADRVDSYRDENGTLWVRVIDYKTGNKTFDLTDIEKGVNLQLPLYLYTIVSSENEALTEKLGGEAGDKLRPAGFLYVGVRPKDGVVPDGGELPTGAKRLPRSGLLVYDEEILRAQDPELSGQYIPVRVKKDGSLYADCVKSTLPEEEFARLYEKLADTVKNIVCDMRSGSADAVPSKKGADSPCKYCKMKAFCRAKEN